MISDIVTIIITIPLIFIVIKYISPYIIRLKNESKTIISMFFLLPLTYYILEYAFTVYTDLLYRGEAVVIEFMDSFIVILYFILSTVILALLNKKNTAERENIILLSAAAQAEKEIAQEKKKAVNEVKGEIGGIAMDIAGKVIEREINEKDHEKLIDEFISNVGEAS